MYKIMSAGPTQVRENVRRARSVECTNPDLDPEFFDYYRETCRRFSKAIGTDDQALILGGEGILGLEAACASLTEKGDRVLVIDNGIFGKGFADFVDIYEGEPVLFSSDYHRPVSADELRTFLENDHDFKYATLVHCDTPSGVINDVSAITSLLDSYGILSVVDSVAGLFGEPLDISSSKIDILCGGSQKALSAPPGLTMVWVSPRAFAAMENRKTPVHSFYANLLNYRDYYKNQWFPYTMPISDIKGLRRALDNFMEDEGVYERHSRIAEAVRIALTAGGLQLYLESGWAATVTVICIPEGITESEILSEMLRDYGILISGCFDVLAGKVVRIGHMGENCNEEDVGETLQAISGVLSNHNIHLKCDIAQEFRKNMESRTEKN